MKLKARFTVEAALAIAIFALGVFIGRRSARSKCSSICGDNNRIYNISLLSGNLAENKIAPQHVDRSICSGNSATAKCVDSANASPLGFHANRSMNAQQKYGDKEKKNAEAADKTGKMEKTEKKKK